MWQTKGIEASPLAVWGLITSENHLARSQSARHKSTNSCSLWVSSFWPGKGCVLTSRTAAEQLELPQLDKAGPAFSDTASAAVALIHCLSRETGPVGDIQGLSWMPSLPACTDLFLEGLIGSGRMMSEEGALWWNIMIPTLLLPLHSLFSLTLLCWPYVPSLLSVLC